MTESQVETETPQTTRRAMLAGAGAVGASALLAACGTDDGGSLADGNGNGGNNPTTPGGGATSATPGGGNDGGGTGQQLASTSDIPENGGKIFKDQNVVVTQPASGDFKAFSAECTHQGCTVTSVRSGSINCACHNSKFSIEDGSVQGGPAKKPLPEVTIKVEGDSITLG